MTENKKLLYGDYLSKLETAIVENNFDNLDYIIEYLQSPNISDERREEIQEIIDEATLYLELKEDEFKDEALRLIGEYK